VQPLPPALVLAQRSNALTSALALRRTQAAMPLAKSNLVRLAFRAAAF
jgi:hypothetical protein